MVRSSRGKRGLSEASILMRDGRRPREGGREVREQE